MSSNGTGLVVRFQQQTTTRLRLFCFPYAGGGASVYRPWIPLLGPDIEVCVVRPPGRDGGFGEPPIASMRALVTQALDEITPLLDVPVAFFGHSLGAIVAYETALALTRGGGPDPLLLIASGHRAPHLLSTRPRLAQLPDQAFIEELAALGGMPPEVLANREILELFMPPLRADFHLAETYRAALTGALVCPVLALGSLDDYVSEEAVAAWREVTSGPFAWRMFEGGHFYINTERAALVAFVADALQRRLISCNTGLSASLS